MVPKGGIENKEFDMNKNGIDDLLKVVSPELVASYEAKNSDGWTLRRINEEYKAATQQTGMNYFGWAKLAIASFFVGAILDGYLQLFTDVPTYVANISFFVVVAPAYLYFMFPARWKFVKDNETRYRCEPILRDFKQAVEALNPLREACVGYNEQFIRYVLFTLAVELLDAEAQFKKERMSENAETLNVLHYGNGEIKCREQLEATIGAAEKFDLVFRKGDLFAEAGRHIWQRNMV